MSLRIVTDADGREPIEQTFASDTVTFGRSIKNDLVLHDDGKQVSNRHGRIELAGGQVLVVDLGSTNGTRIDDRLLPKHEPAELHAGEVVHVGPFRITVEPLADTAADDDLDDDLDDADRTIVRVDPTRAADGLRATLVRTYARMRAASPDARRATLRRIIQTTVDNLPPEQARAVLAAIPGRLAPVDPVAAPAAPDEREELYRAGFAAVRDLAMHFVGDGGFTDASDVGRFTRLVQQALDVFGQWLASSIQGRDEFQSQFSADVTMMFQLRSNPLKGGRSADELLAYLLSWRNDDPIGKIRRALEDVCRDQTIHQLGLLSGAHEAVKAVLSRLDPELVRRQAEAEGRGWLARNKEWDVYCRTHRELSEPARLFEEIVGPAINQGYLQAHEQHLGEQDSRESESGATPGATP